jgi:hypothetical protein
MIEVDHEGLAIESERWKATSHKHDQSVVN